MEGSACGMVYLCVFGEQSGILVYCSQMLLSASVSQATNSSHSHLPYSHPSRSTLHAICKVKVNLSIFIRLRGLGPYPSFAGFA